MQLQVDRCKTIVSGILMSSGEARGEGTLRTTVNAFLDGVAADSKLNQRDGIHPTAAGVDAIVARILPKAEELVVRVRDSRAK